MITPRSQSDLRRSLRRLKRFKNLTPRGLDTGTGSRPNTRYKPHRRGFPGHGDKRSLKAPKCRLFGYCIHKDIARLRRNQKCQKNFVKKTKRYRFVLQRTIDDA
jgi:hypothetical protein